MNQWSTHESMIHPWICMHMYILMHDLVKNWCSLVNPRFVHESMNHSWIMIIHESMINPWIHDQSMNPWLIHESMDDQSMINPSNPRSIHESKINPWIHDQSTNPWSIHESKIIDQSTNPWSIHDSIINPRIHDQSMNPWSIYDPSIKILFHRINSFQSIYIMWVDCILYDCTVNS